ncbi:Zinc finger, CCCH-type [Dillenia turbinata]|uniref:Zinc finger, CCCH-type n=1 Tax=Dillenia turbinata TaxID=194707 RepID=A0AAN8U9A4_9MAGN
MEFDSGISISSRADHPSSLSVSVSTPLDEDAMWAMNLRASETMESGLYPERPGEPDCAYYMRTGLCRFGATCRFNHPPNRKLAIANARMKGEYPERIGQPECQAYIPAIVVPEHTICSLVLDMYNEYSYCLIERQYSELHMIELEASSFHSDCEELTFYFDPTFQYYLKTGTCKFGATCKFHHPREKAGIAGRVSLNILGYPLRPNEIECAYYLRTGQCKFGNTCKFHHPQPSNMILRGSPVCSSLHSPTNPGQQSYPGGITNWPLSRASYIPSPRWQGSSSYAPLLLPQGVVSVPGWNAYSGHLGSVSSSESQQQTVGSSQIYGTSRQSELANVGSQGTYSPYRSGSLSLGFYALQRENIFPERPGQPECQFYMKTGDCKFGAVCRFHHPRERHIPAPDCLLSPMGLPLRPLSDGPMFTFKQGEPLCIFYSRYGICKFGPNCKFDHPMGIFTYNLSASTSADAPVVRHLLDSSSGAALSLSTEGLVDPSSGKARHLSLSETRQISSGGDNIDTEG